MSRDVADVITRAHFGVYKLKGVRGGVEIWHGWSPLLADALLLQIILSAA